MAHEFRRQLELALQLPLCDDEKSKNWVELGKSVGQPNILRDIISAYLDSAEKMVPLLRDTRTSAGVTDLIQACHKLKSSSGTLGFVRLQTLCDLTENHLKANQSPPRDLESLSQLILKEYEATKQELPRLAS